MRKDAKRAKRTKIWEAKVYSDGRKAKSLFRYGLEIVTEFLVKGWENDWIATLAFLSVSNPLKIRRQQVLSCTKVSEILKNVLNIFA